MAKAGVSKKAPLEKSVVSAIWGWHKVIRLCGGQRADKELVCNAVTGTTA